MKERSYADLHAGDYEVSHTFGPAGEVYYFLNEPQYVKQLQDWMHGHYCPHPQLGSHKRSGANQRRARHLRQSCLRTTTANPPQTITGRGYDEQIHAIAPV